eukprot:TRINITY_DN8897_c0_g1_i2.p1 TRINITY_DN8897_c0_g1~~TRINITY_DN8897_c0_g1_i2.p1  ORF type:complete len:276 (+),score=47.47 TRINITY_DN8897_c0_g1_i2:554-1381(+)
MNELPALEKLVQDLNSGEPTYGSGVRSSGEAEAELRECKRNITELEERLESALQSADETRLVQLRNVRDATFKELTELTSELDVKTHQLFFTIAPEKTHDLQLSMDFLKRDNNPAIRFDERLIRAGNVKVHIFVVHNWKNSGSYTDNATNFVEWLRIIRSHVGCIAADSDLLIVCGDCNCNTKKPDSATMAQVAVILDSELYHWEKGAGFHATPELRQGDVMFALMLRNQTRGNTQCFGQKTPDQAGLLEHPSYLLEIWDTRVSVPGKSAISQSS